MNFTIHQSITIQTLKIGAITNSSVLQIGSAGSICGHSDIHNTGGFTKPAKPAEPLEGALPLSHGQAKSFSGSPAPETVQSDSINGVLPKAVEGVPLVPLKLPKPKTP